jgi:8-oxo-dGTP diphosphatase
VLIVPKPTEICIVAAILRNGTGQCLLARKRPGLANEGLFEFPGGKVESGEEKHTALQRELAEELDLIVQVPEAAVLSYVHTLNDDTSLRFDVFEIQLDETPELRSTDHDLLIWCPTGELHNHAVAQADLPIVRYLQHQ